MWSLMWDVWKAVSSQQPADDACSVRKHDTFNKKQICRFVLRHTLVRHNHSYLTVWVPQEGWGAANVTGHQNKVSESWLTGSESNLLHLSNSTGNKQELSQTSIKLWFVWTRVYGTACRYLLWLNRGRIQQTVLTWSCVTHTQFF